MNNSGAIRVIVANVPQDAGAIQPDQVAFGQGIVPIARAGLRYDCGPLASGPQHPERDV
jgi:hypothetical protein